MSNFFFFFFPFLMQRFNNIFVFCCISTPTDGPAHLRQEATTTQLLTPGPIFLWLPNFYSDFGFLIAAVTFFFFFFESAVDFNGKSLFIDSGETD